MMSLPSQSTGCATIIPGSFGCIKQEPDFVFLVIPPN